MDKQQRYRQKCISEGRCPHCGKPCAPYYECEVRRLYKSFDYTLTRLVLEGKVEKRKISPGYRFLENGKPLKLV